MIVVGIDPGKTGGYAVLANELISPITVFPMPDINELAANLWRISHYGKLHVFLEKAQAFPGQGVSSMFNYGVHFGMLQGVFAAQEAAYTLVTPQTWMKKMHMGTKGGTTKEKSVEACQRLFPQISITPPNSRSKKPHLGMVEALLIAEFGRRHVLQSQS